MTYANELNYVYLIRFIIFMIGGILGMIMFACLLKKHNPMKVTFGYVMIMASIVLYRVHWGLNI